MRILFVGDVIGRPGRRVLLRWLDEVRAQESVDFTIINVENAAGGFGLNREVFNQIWPMSPDVMTSGNHIWDKKEVLGLLESQPRLLRPANYPDAPGSGSVVVPSSGGTPVAVLNLQGRVFMPPLDCPFRTADRELERLKQRAAVVIVDFHAEATSEKNAMGWYLDGRVSAVLGTHTHVPTSDARLLADGTAYVTDVGMTGPINSIIGMKVRPSLDRMLSGRHARFEVAAGPARLSSVVLEVDEGTGRALSIRRLDRVEE